MSQVTTILSNVTVSAGYQGAPQTKFSAKEGSQYGMLSFKVSHKKKPAKAGEKGGYDNYSITLRNVKSDAKIIELLNTPQIKVNITGFQTIEEYDGKKFVRVTCEGQDAISVNFSDNSNFEAQPAPRVNTDFPPVNNDEL